MDTRKQWKMTVLLVCALAVRHICPAQATSQPGMAAPVKYALEGNITLDSLTRYLHRHGSLRFSFNSVRVKGSAIIHFPKAAYTLRQILVQIRKTTSLYYAYYNGYVIFQDNPPKQSHPPQTITKQPPIKRRPAVKSPSPLIGKNMVKASPAKEEKDSAAVKNKQDSATAPALPVRQPPATTANVGKSNTVNSSSTTVQKKPVKADQRSANRAAASGSNEKDHAGIAFHAGLLWEPVLPFQGFRYYFTGANGRSQPYMWLIPGLRASVVFGDAHELSLECEPVQPYFTGNTMIDSLREFVSPSDSTLANKLNSLIKISGPAAAFRYDYHISDRLAVGAGIHYHLVRSALIDRRMSFYNGRLPYDSIVGIRSSDPDWRLLKSSFLGVSASLGYQFNKLQAGLRLQLPVTNISDTAGARMRPLNGQVFLKWTIL